MAEGAEDPGLVLLTTCGSREEAALIRSLLEACGVESFVQGETHRSMMGDALGAFIDLRVMVNAADVERAKAALEAEAQDEPGDDGARAPEGEEARCPKHGFASTGACARCGTFLCPRCGDGCPTCDDALGEQESEHEKNKRVMGWAFFALVAAGAGVATLMALFGARPR